MSFTDFQPRLASRRFLGCRGLECVSAVLVIAAALVMPAEAQKQDLKDDESAIRKAATSYVHAIRRGDADAIAAAWTTHGKFIDSDGQTHVAHDLIKEHFGDDDSTVEQSAGQAHLDHESSIRFVTPNVAIEQGTMSIGDESAAGSFTAIWVKQNHRWMLDTLHERSAASDMPENPLDPLRWMMGDWVGQGDGNRVTCSTNWSENRKFIIRRFRVEREGQVVMSGSQRIGWDAAAKRLRSWAFDTTGGIVEGTWRREGEAWIVKSTGILPDGNQSRTVEFWVPEGADRCVAKFGHVAIGDTVIEDSVVEFRRINE